MLRLVRAGAGEPVELLRDPFGNGISPLRCRRTRERLVLWSVGVDGADDGGSAQRSTSGFEVLFAGLHVNTLGSDLALVTGPTDAPRDGAR